MSSAPVPGPWRGPLSWPAFVSANLFFGALSLAGVASLLSLVPVTAGVIQAYHPRGPALFAFMGALFVGALLATLVSRSIQIFYWLLPRERGAGALLGTQARRLWTATGSDGDRGALQVRLIARLLIRRSARWMRREILVVALEEPIRPLVLGGPSGVAPRPGLTPLPNLEETLPRNFWLVGEELGDAAQLLDATFLAALEAEDDPSLTLAARDHELLLCTDLPLSEARERRLKGILRDAAARRQARRQALREALSTRTIKRPRAEEPAWKSIVSGERAKALACGEEARPAAERPVSRRRDAPSDAGGLRSEVERPVTVQNRLDTPEKGLPRAVLAGPEADTRPHPAPAPNPPERRWAAADVPTVAFSRGGAAPRASDPEARSAPASEVETQQLVWRFPVDEDAAVEGDMVGDWS